MATIYRGCRVGDMAVITVNGESLPPRTDLRDISPSGFAWGHSGGGAAQLALAILAHYFPACAGIESPISDELATGLYTRYKRDVIATLPGNTFEISSDAVAAWLAANDPYVQAVLAEYESRAESPY
jgi:hypothetical protein